ncbi:T9SS type A sorting domain-containing protein [Hymenobacter sp. H14-R3]|uniref:T9SS type A sorting domain-containing protein n=1 Tax=Hymenobacter sp. H14-R3 TaxID=3046308 RepID=UPI0024B9ABD5|nr:T9SS type A sorting domain-containing protein [Hymenobacter sp. H14-R3]MDJ0367633.1 T9SS type A sorting domain-containing protein [Hymenobacter sp. H14-R3]
MPTVNWGGYFGSSITVAPTINNYGTWKSAMQPTPGGTITNASGATWDAYLTTSANLSITNAGTWSTQVQDGGNNPTISIIQNAGSWTGGISQNNGSLRITNNATWTQAFNFPGGNANAFTTATGANTAIGGYLGLGGTVVLVNNGTMSVSGGMAALASTSSLTNAAGSTFAIVGEFTSTGRVINLGAISSTGNFTNGGTITGGTAMRQRGIFRAAGYTVNNGKFGADNSFLDFCDSTPPTPASNGFDARGGTIGSNVTFCSTAPLPVSLTSFSAQRRASQVLVRWATASELNNKEFVVERSADGQAFVALQTVAGHGTVAYAHAYQVTDARPLPGLSYYRLRQVDQDGTRTYSPVATVSRLAAQVAVYPNPTADVLTLDLSGLAASACQVRLCSLLGQLVLSQTLAGGQAQPLSLAGLPAGTYLLEVASATQGRQVQRVVKR